MQNLYQTYREKMARITDLSYASSVLNWDQETYMPPKGAALRSRQMATLAGITHEMFVDPEIGKLLKTLSEDASLDDIQKRNVRESLRNYEKNLKYTTAFVEEMSRTVSESFLAWEKAKRASDFSIFEKPLSKLVELKKKECELLGYTDHPYDAQLDQYEPGAKTADLTKLFSDVRAQLVDFVREIAAQPQVDDSVMHKFYAKDKQWDLGIELLKQMGYDFEAGRQDISTHPFTTNFGASDVRVTTRIDEQNLGDMIWSCIHEGGHALYEQGIPGEEYGLPSGEYLSLGIHESQSRLWENNVGRSLGYWKANIGLLKKYFPEQLAGTDEHGFYKAMNKVQPSLIRTNADELTYHFHVLIRFEIEKALFEGKISVKELPEYWNARYKEYLGIDVPNHAQGVLQDIHWSHGSFGYFPTYSLGSFYAAQFYAAAQSAVPGLEKQIESGELKPLLDWLREHVHRHGKTYTADELCMRITGEKLNFAHFMNYARKKYAGIYELKVKIKEIERN
ncbi:MAG: carboxypeptidase Taq [Bacteroidetes bacterium]|nr:MAG: carboxypeptidase Taq [Bacteroidota bacterium]